MKGTRTKNKAAYPEQRKICVIPPLRRRGWRSHPIADTLRKESLKKRRADNMGNKNRRRAVNLLTTLIVLAALFGFYIHCRGGHRLRRRAREYTDRADSSFLLLDSDPSLSVSTEPLRRRQARRRNRRTRRRSRRRICRSLCSRRLRPTGRAVRSRRARRPAGNRTSRAATASIPCRRIWCISIPPSSTAQPRRCGYSFTIQHNLEALQQYALTPPVSTAVEVNGWGVPQFSGMVSLDNGANTITVSAQYSMRDGTTRTVPSPHGLL